MFEMKIFYFHISNVYPMYNVNYMYVNESSKSTFTMLRQEFVGICG